MQKLAATGSLMKPWLVWPPASPKGVPGSWVCPMTIMVPVGMMAGLRALLRESIFGKFRKEIPGGKGGDVLRKLIRQFMGEKPAPSPIENSDPSDIFLNPTKIAQGRILPGNRLYVKLVDIVKPLGIRLGKVQGGDQRFINLISDNFRPKFLTVSPSSRIKHG